MAHHAKYKIGDTFKITVTFDDKTGFPESNHLFTVVSKTGKVWYLPADELEAGEYIPCPEPIKFGVGDFVQYGILKGVVLREPVAGTIFVRYMDGSSHWTDPKGFKLIKELS